ncbi:hypothetical protein RHGRI_007981 [Rhododendron griersonianum]|uniref:Inhibitor I9 domain-containing protein n=1 Tax=Rhododendron griersonianum TaxID=479676 RepID=A0AAV6L0M6_9ERIC|nr:hypothetical protein RHGRI_007981 [Rhododendron griersonianum]
MFKSNTNSFRLKKKEHKIASKRPLIDPDEELHVSPATSDSHQSPARVLYTYDSAADGFSAVLSEDEMETVKKLPGFLSAYGDRQVTVDTTHTFEFLSLNPVTGLRPAASDYGKDCGSSGGGEVMGEWWWWCSGGGGVVEVVVGVVEWWWWWWSGDCGGGMVEMVVGVMVVEW